MTFFTYIKSLIDGDTNDDVKDFGAMLFYWVLAVICLITTIVLLCFNQWPSVLILIGSIMTFIFTLLGLKTYKEVKTNKTPESHDGNRDKTD